MDSNKVIKDPLKANISENYADIYDYLMYIRTLLQSQAYLTTEQRDNLLIDLNDIINRINKDRFNF